MSYEQFKVFWILFKNWKIMVDYERGNGSKNYLTKKASQLPGNLVGISKKCRTFKFDLQRGNSSKNYLTKKASHPTGNFAVFSKKMQ